MINKELLLCQMKKCNKTIEQLSADTGMSQSLLEKKLNGLSQLNLFDVISICEALKISNGGIFFNNFVHN